MIQNLDSIMIYFWVIFAIVLFIVWIVPFALRCHGLKIKKFSFLFAWYDMWMGLFIDQKKLAVYVFVLPMIGCKVELKKLSQ